MLINTVRAESRAWLLAPAILFVLAGCDRPSDPVSPNAESRPDLSITQQPEVLSAFPPLQERIEAVTISLPDKPMPWEHDDEALVEAIRQMDGKAYVSFKPPHSRSTRETGIIPSMSRADAMEGRRTVQALGAEIIRTFSLSSTIVITISPEVAPEIRKLPIVNWIEPAGEGKITGNFNPEEIDWGILKVRAPESWLWAANRGQGAFITILDTGTDLDHFISGDAGNLSRCLYASSPWITSCWDDNGHGSHVLGIAAAQQNYVGFIGVANGPRGLASVKVCNAAGDCTHEDVAGGLEWTVTNGEPRQIVNMSISGISHNNLLAEYVSRSYNAGNLLVASAGNEPWQSSVGYPARYPQVIAVSGTLEDDGFAEYPNFYCSRSKGLSGYTGSVSGSEVELSAPFHARSMILNGDYDNDCGTSMAAPHVTGVAALIWTQWPNWSAVDVRGRLQSTAVDLGPSGRDNKFGFGRVDAVRALGISDPTQLTVSITGPGSATPGINAWEAVTNGGTGNYVYQWSKRNCFTSPQNCSNWSDVGTGDTYTASFHGAEPDFQLRVVVTSGNQTATQHRYVQGPCHVSEFQCPLHAGQH